MKTKSRSLKFLKPLAVTLILVVLMSNPVQANTSFFVSEFWRLQLLLHVLPLTAFVLSYVWGKEYLAARIVAYVLCFIATLIGVLDTLFMWLMGDEGLFLLLTLIWSSAGVTYMTINRTENNKHLTTPKL